MRTERTQPRETNEPVVALPGGEVDVIGGGLAGSEAALILAEEGFSVRLWEMRPGASGPAHHTAGLAELVCSNSFKGTDPTAATGRLKRELEVLGSNLLRIAHATRVPAGAALAVDRDEFSAAVTAAVEGHPGIALVREQALSIPAGSPVIVAVGPLPSASIEDALSKLVGEARLAFFDAAAPIVDANTLDRSIVFEASRYDKGESADYLNCPLTETEYLALRDALVGAERVRAQEFERGELFSACQPIEEIARSGLDAMRFGPLKPVGLTDPRTGERPHAVVQLRAENRDRTAYNLVGFQTNLTWPEQRRVFATIPGLARVEFLRLGVMHRNTFVDAPRLLRPDLALRARPDVRIAGQLAGTEGYLEAIGTGLLAALSLVAETRSLPTVTLPRETALGALVAYATDPATSDYQPMHVNWGLVPPLPERVRGKRARYEAYAARAQSALRAYVATHPLLATRAEANADV